MSEIPKFIAVDSDFDESISIYGKGDTIEEAVSMFKDEWLSYNGSEPSKIEVYEPDEASEEEAEHYGWGWKIGDYKPVKIIDWNPNPQQPT